MKLDFSPITEDEEMEMWDEIADSKNGLLDRPRHYDDYFRHRHLSIDPLVAAERLLPHINKEDRDAHWVVRRLFDRGKNCGMILDDVGLFCQFYDNLKLDFVYDAMSNLFFLDLYARHELLRSQLYEMYTGDISALHRGSADKWLENDMGFFKSSQSSIIWAGPNIRIPPELKTRFTTLTRFEKD